MNPKRIVWGEYRTRNGDTYDFEITFDGDRKHGLREWARKAIANGGTAAKADEALAMTVRKKP